MRTLLWILTLGVSLLAGCALSPQPAVFLTPDKCQFLLNNKRTVLEGTITDLKRGAILTFQENYFQPYPDDPVNGFTQSFTIKVDSVLKGTFNGSVLQLDELQDPDHKHDRIHLKTDLLRGKKVYVGWDKESCGGYENLMLVNAEDQSATQPSSRR